MTLDGTPFVSNHDQLYELLAALKAGCSQNQDRIGSDRIGLTKPGLDRTGLTKSGSD